MEFLFNQLIVKYKIKIIIAFKIVVNIKFSLNTFNISIQMEINILVNKLMVNFKAKVNINIVQEIYIMVNNFKSRVILK